MTTKPASFEWESPDGAGTTSAASTRLRRGDISARVTKERRQMLTKTLPLTDGQTSPHFPFQALAENCGFKVISEDGTSDLDSWSDTTSTCASLCWSDPEWEGRRSEQRIRRPASSASEVSHVSLFGANTRGVGRSSPGMLGRSTPIMPGHPSQQREGGVERKAAVKKIPVVDNIGSPRQAVDDTGTARHPEVSRILPPESLPAKCKNIAKQNTTTSGSLKSHGDFKMAESFKPSTSKFKFFMEQPGSPTPRALGAFNTEHKKHAQHAHGVGEGVRAKRQSIPAIVESDFESDEEEILMPTMQSKRRMPKRTGGMVYQLRESKLHADPYQPLDGSSLPLDGSSRPFQGSSQPFQGSSQPFQGSSQPLEVSSTADDSLAALNVNNTHLTLRPSANQSRRVSTRENKILDFNKNWTPDKTLSLDDVNSLTDEITASPNQSTGHQGDSDNCSDKRHEDYKQNINSNCEDDGGDEICASAFIGQYLYELWKNQCLCDVRIRVGKSSYLAHKIVLAAFSDVFCPNEPQKLPSLCFDIPNSTPDAVYQILLYLYTSEMELTDGILEDVLNAACFMGIWEVICLIKEILSKPTFENFGMYMGIRERQGMSCGLLDFPDIVREHLLELVDTPHFLNLTIADLETLLKDPDIMVESETDIVHVISKWIEYNPFHRIKCAARLLSLVNFDCMPPETLFDIVEEKKHLFDIDAVQVLLEAFKNHALKPKEPPHTPVQSRGFTDKEKDRKCGSCGSESNLQMDPMFSFTERRPSDSQVKSFREIRDQFASQRQTEARRMCPCPSLSRITRDNPDLDNPLPSRLTVKKNTPRGMEKGGLRADDKGGLRADDKGLLRADDEYRYPYKGDARGQQPDELRAGREYNLGSTNGKYRADEDSAPFNQRNADVSRRTMDRRNKNINGIKSSPGYDVDDRSRQASLEDRSRQASLEDRSRQASLEDKGRQGSLEDRGRQVSFDPRGWQNNNESKSKSGRGGWNTSSGMVEEEDEEDDFLPPPPRKRNVRRRGDIIKSYSSPGETSGSDRLCRKKVTFS